MRIGVVSHMFPTKQRTVFGVFVKDELDNLAKHVNIRLIAPIPTGYWFEGKNISSSETEYTVKRPLVFSFPRYFLQKLYPDSMALTLKKSSKDFFEDCDIIMSSAGKEILAQKVQGDYKDKEIILPNITFEGEYKIKDGFREIHIIETHGHTQGSSYVYLPDESVLLTGDLLFADMFPFAGDPSVNPYLWIEAFQKMIDLKPNLVIPGHGPIGSVKELIEGQNLIREMLEFIEKKIDQNSTFTDILVSKDKPDFCDDASARWLKMTIEAFYSVILKKKNS